MFGGSVLILTVIILTAGGASVFQLVDSSGSYIRTGEQEGLLLHNGGTVCYSYFNITAAQAICKVMGFEGALGQTSGQKWKIQSTFSSVINNVKCPLPDWSSCSYTSHGGCGHGGDVFLTCSGTRSSFSLVDKRGFTVSGSQEFLLLYNGGTVCGHQFSNNSADAACRDLGYSGAESWRVGMCWNAGTYRIALDDMNCTEGHLNSCSYSTSHNCVHGTDIFISCKSRQDSDSKTLGSSSEQEKLDMVKETEDNVTVISSESGDSVKEAGENIAIAILTLVCTVLVFLLVKKNSQMDRKDLQITELLKKMEKIDHLEEMVTKIKANQNRKFSFTSDDDH